MKEWIKLPGFFPAVCCWTRCVIGDLDGICCVSHTPVENGSLEHDPPCECMHTACRMVLQNSCVTQWVHTLPGYQPEAPVPTLEKCSLVITLRFGSQHRTFGTNEQEPKHAGMQCWCHIHVCLFSSFFFFKFLEEIGLKKKQVLFESCFSGSYQNWASQMALGDWGSKSYSILILFFFPRSTLNSHLCHQLSDRTNDVSAWAGFVLSGSVTLSAVDPEL